MAAPDLGNAHVIDWYLYREAKHIADEDKRIRDMTLVYTQRDYTFDPEDWTRYDGELL